MLCHSLMVGTNTHTLFLGLVLLHDTAVLPAPFTLLFLAPTLIKSLQLGVPSF